MFRCRRSWPGCKFNGNLDLRARARLETPLRIRFESRTIELFVSGALQHSCSGHCTRLLIDGDQNDALSCEPLFRPFRPVYRLWRVNRLRRKHLCRSRSSGLSLQRRKRKKPGKKNEAETAYQFSSANPAAFANKTRRHRAHSRVRDSMDDSIEQIVSKPSRESEAGQRWQPA